MRREQDPSFPKSGHVNVLEIKLNSNLNAQSLEEMERNRMKVCEDFAKNLGMESCHYFRGCPRDKSGHAIIAMDHIVEHNKALVSMVTRHEPAVFNDTQKFQDTIKALSDVHYSKQ